MESVFARNTPRVRAWWRLTEKGAKVVQAWMKMGFTAADLSSGSYLDHYQLASRRLGQDPPMKRIIPNEIVID